MSIVALAVGLSNSSMFSWTGASMALIGETLFSFFSGRLQKWVKRLTIAAKIIARNIISQRV